MNSIKILYPVIFLYLVSLTTSIAGMEFFSTLIIILFFLIFAFQKWIKKTTLINYSKIGNDWAYWALWISTIIGAFTLSFVPSHLQIQVIGELRWILALFTLVAVFINFELPHKKILYTLFIAMSLIAIYGIIQSRTGIDLIRNKTYRADVYSGIQFWRVRGFFSNTMSYAYSTGLGVCLIYVAIAKQTFHNKNKLLLCSCSALIFLSFFLTFTRGAWIGIFAAVATMSMMINWRRGMKLIGVFVLLIVLLSALFAPIRERIYTIYKEPPKAKSVSQRYELWNANWEMFKDSPILGVGYDLNSYHTKEYNLRLYGKEGFIGNAHNNFLQVLAGGGLVGFLLWLSICISMFYYSIKLWLTTRNQNNWAEFIALGSIGAQIFFHVGGLTQATFFDKEPLHFYILIIALMLAEYRQVVIYKKTSAQIA
jgi:O-antigen ligase